VVSTDPGARHNDQIDPDRLLQDVATLSASSAATS
jgi:hypothetical protein